MKTIEKITEFIRLYGTKSSDYLYLGIRSGEFIIDGREFAEEYEDLSSKAPCQIDYIALNSDDFSPWFNMFTIFSTHYLLMSNDKYNLDAVDEKILKDILKYLEEKFKNKPISDKRKKDLMKGKWLSRIGWGWYFPKLTPETDITASNPGFTNFNDLIDCSYCCFNEDDKYNLKDFGTNDLDEFALKILNLIDKNLAFLLRVQYPTYKDLFSSAYLARQDNERWKRWNDIIPLINKKIDSLISKEEVNRILEIDPNVALKKTDNPEKLYLKDKYLK
jgi:hypothetical protein